jgi:hypothetical protein
MATLTLPTPSTSSDEVVRISVLVIEDDRAEAVNIAGPVASAVRSAFADPRLSGPLQTLRMDADRLIGRIRERWDAPFAEDEAPQFWEKSDGSTIVRWCVERKRARLPRFTQN